MPFSTVVIRVESGLYVTRDGLLKRDGQRAGSVCKPCVGDVSEESNGPNKRAICYHFCGIFGIPCSGKVECGWEERMLASCFVMAMVVDYF